MQDTLRSGQSDVTDTVGLGLSVRVGVGVGVGLELITSATSRLNSGVEPLQFDPGIFDTELPVNPALFSVGFIGPDCDFRLQVKNMIDPTVAQTLTG